MLATLIPRAELNYITSIGDDVTFLQKELNARSKRTRASIDIELKQKELYLRLQLMQSFHE